MTEIYTPASNQRWAHLLDRLAVAALYAFVFVMPWEDAVPLLGGFVVSRWITVLAGGLLVLRIAADGRFRKPSPIHSLMLALVGWSVLSLLWTVDHESTIIRAGTFLQLLVLVFIIWELVQTHDRAVKLFQAYVFGAFVLAAGTLVNFARGIQAADLVAEQGGVKYHDSRYSMLGVNENDLGLMIALSMPMALYLMSRRKNPWMTSFCWIHIGTCFTALFLAGSRGGLIATVVGMLMFPLIMSRLQKWQRVAFVMVCAVGAAAGIYLVPEVTWERLLSTETEFSQGTLTHRTVLWDAGLQVFRDHPFVGVGAGAYGPAITRSVDVPLIAHNTFLSILVEQGVVGELFWLALLGCLFYCATRPQYAERCLWLIILLTWTIGVNSLTWEYHKTTWFLFGLLTAHAYVRRGTAVSRDLNRIPVSLHPEELYISHAIVGEKP